MLLQFEAAAIIRLRPYWRILSEGRRAAGNVIVRSWAPDGNGSIQRIGR